ncbi:hypothetical protein HXX76_010404 [Chlamydomonas incerta]|uniref:glycerophosphodiester phosphodiesterase n=1 Tax=Chlamydomonas incerta TaxID=51695 RepID=A0A835VR00_CHLIN|nr:hypothetical protein HXX76_010404 [Chlamydomonas incerta]|eukprot:KAG2422623.1 hypothetical protein HXX76_010404 [Chlamydomonas incerta]
MAAHIVALALFALGASAALGPDIDIMVPGYPLVDGPMPHKRMVAQTLDRTKPYAIGHRGDAGEFPEHSSLAYLSGIKHGADFIECCDVVLTKDYVPICRHEPLLSNTTNADDVFPTRKKTYVIDGYNSTGVHAIDLTLKEVRKLKLRERLYSRSQVYNDYYPVVTFEECIYMAQHAPRVVGIYPETKHPTWHDTLIKARKGKTTITDQVLYYLKKHGYGAALNTPEWLARPVFLQSFESNNLAYARTKSEVPIIQLMDATNAPLPDGSFANYSAMMTSESLAKIAKYANGIGPWKETLQQTVTRADGTQYLNSTGLVERAHAAGLQVHLYTLRNEPNYHSNTLTSIEAEYAYYFKTLGVDGGFTDFPGTLAQWLRNEVAMNTTWPNLKL